MFNGGSFIDKVILFKSDILPQTIIGKIYRVTYVCRFFDVDRVLNHESTEKPSTFELETSKLAVSENMESRTSLHLVMDIFFI